MPEIVVPLMRIGSETRACKLLGQRMRAFEVGALRYHDEFVPAEPAGSVVRLKASADRVADVAQERISDLVPIGVIDGA